jgi:hypothetical protein
MKFLATAPSERDGIKSQGDRMQYRTNPTEYEGTSFITIKNI